VHSQDLRSPLNRAAGLGSAGDGVGRWWMERVTAVALVLLALWFVASIIALAGSDHAAFVAWLREPLAALLMVLLATLFAHLALDAGGDRATSTPQRSQHCLRCASAARRWRPPVSSHRCITFGG
jgi:hypothetical protein